MIDHDAPPAWFADLPAFSPRLPERKVVIVDTQVLSYRLLDGKVDSDLNFLFESDRLVLQVCRQTINEALWSTAVDDDGTDVVTVNGRPKRVRVAPPGWQTTFRPGLPNELHRKMWEGLSALQATEKVFLSGLTQMTPAQRCQYDDLAQAITHVCSRKVGSKDALVAADGLVKRVPIYTRDEDFRNAFLRARQQDPTLRAKLTDYGAFEFAKRLFVG